MGLQTIVHGHINEVLGKNKGLSEERMEICRRCPLYLDKMGGICNSRLFLNPQTDEVSTSKKLGYIKGCGCRLKAKTALNHSHCVANKW